MHLYLSSYRIGDHPEQLTALLGENTHAAVIGNARDQLSGEERATRMQQEHDDLRGLGLTTEEVDLRDFFEDQAALPAVLDRFGLLWFRGGNTFLLRRALAQSGADAYLRSRVADENLVYGGYSAGACVLSPTLQGIDLADEPDFAPEPYNPEVIWNGLGFVPYWLVPHYESDHFESAMMENVVQFYQANNLPYRTLQDGEVSIDRTH